MRCLLLLKFILIFSVFTGNAQNQANQWNIQLRTGDLLFCSANTGTLSKAIDQVTQTGAGTHFDHVGIAEILNDTVWVLHAAPQKGVCRETIDRFLDHDKSPARSVVVYRLKSRYFKAIPSAIQKGTTLLGQPYNCTYIIKDQGYYCSEYIYELFKSDSIFTLNPMTFRDPGTGQFLSGWSDHYKKLGIPVPEGEPGCNPNGLAASDKLEIAGQLIFMGKN